MAKITQLSQLDLNQTYSYADYLTWQFKETVELIKGKIMLMSPAPNVVHQRVSMNFSGSLFNFFKRKNARFLLHPLMSACRTVENTFLQMKTFTP